MMIKPAINNIAHLEGDGKPPLEMEACTEYQPFHDRKYCKSWLLVRLLFSIQRLH